MQIFRYNDGVLANTILLLYLTVGTVVAVALLADISLALDNGMAAGVAVLTIIIATLALAHLMILAAYLTHECMHNTVFKKPAHNDYLGNLIAWLLGAGYLPYKMLKDKHLRHHTERRDVLALDYRQLLKKYQLWRTIISIGQWCHIPAAELFSHGLSVCSPFFLRQKRQWRRRVVFVAISRLVFFLLLYFVNPALLIAYVMASVICIAVLGFMDAYQHTYDIVLNLDDGKSPPDQDRVYEEAHTFSNLLSHKLPWLNLLVLNFCYHNVHHWKSGEPWYRLPRLHRQRYPDGSAQEIPFVEQWHNYHSHRVARIDWQVDRNEQQVQAIGASGVSFLVGV